MGVGVQEYGIWSWVPERARRRAAKRRYRENEQGRRVSRDGSCPLGEALRAMGVALGSPRPSGYEVALALCVRDPAAPFDELCAQARAFSRDWDRGLVGPADLPRVMGLAPTDAPPKLRRLVAPVERPGAA